MDGLYSLAALYRILRDCSCKFIYNKFTPHNVPRLYKKSFITDLTYYFSCPTHIIDGIYIGSSYNASNYNQLYDIEIECVMNMANGEVGNYFESEYNYFSVDLNDDTGDSMTRYFDEVYNYLNENKDKKIFVHCLMGASRSAIVVLLYLMLIKDMDYSQSIDYLYTKRESVSPNLKFLKELFDYVNEKKKNKSSLM